MWSTFTDVSKHHNAGIWGMDRTYNILCPKTYAALGMCHNQALVRSKPLGAPASVKLVFCVYIVLDWK